MVIYALVTTSSGSPFYVGQTTDPDRRAREHFREWGAEHPGMLLMVLEVTTWDRADEVESRWAHALRVAGGCGCFGNSLLESCPIPKRDDERCRVWADEVILGWDLERTRRSWERFHAGT